MKPHMVMGLVLAMAFGIGGTSASADFVYGITDNGRISRVDLTTKTETFLTGALGTNANGVALDLANNRLLFRSPATEKGLHSMDLSTNAVTSISISGLPGDSSSAAFHDGAYWYVNQNTDDLYKVTTSGSTGAYGKIADFTNNAKKFSFGDIAITADGTLYGSASGAFFKLNLTNPAGTYQLLSTTMPQLQIAILTNGSIIGQDHGTGQWYNVSSTGAATKINGFVTTKLRDIAGTVVPEPTSIAMMGLGVGAALAFARRRLKARA